MRTLEGNGVSPGIAIGPLMLLERESHEVFRRSLDSAEVESELARLDEAVVTTKEELERTQDRVRARLGRDMAGILEAQDLILTDPTFLEAIRRRIRGDMVNAEWALQRASADLGAQFAQIENQHLRERGQDLHHVTRYLLRSLLGQAPRDFAGIDGPVIVAADELTPTEVLVLGRKGVVGFAIAGGGLTSHTTIMARALNIPLVSGLTEILEWREQKTSGNSILDGDNGRLIIEPSEAVVERHLRQQSRAVEQERRLTTLADQATVTLDGTDIELRANLELPDEIEDCLRFGARGVGLYRSEFLYIEKSPELPTEQEQIEVLEHLLTTMAPHPVVVRTFDLGGRKLARDVIQTDEENPNLGLRGIRLTLARPEIFRTQLRALLRAAVKGNLKVMIPLVSTLSEIRAFKSALEEVRQELADEGVEHSADFPVGTMIEVPAAALIADRIAKEVDFLSIGTNDLIQYSLAVDRNNEHVSHLYQPLHPAVLTMVRLVIEAAASEGIEVSMCGEMAGDPAMTPILLGLGLRVFSMTPRNVPIVIERLRTLDITELHGTAWRCTQMASPEDVKAHLKQLGLMQ